MRKFEKLYIGEDNDKILSFINLHRGTVFHEPYFNQLIQKYWQTDFYYLADSVDEFTIICPTHSTENFITERISFKALGDVPYGGFIGAKSVLEKDLKPGFFQRIEYSGIPLLTNEESSFKRHGETSIIDLSLSEDDIFQKVIDSKRRNMIRKALKNDVKVVKYDTIKGFELYKPLLEDLHLRLGYTYLDVNFYRDLFKHYSGLGQAIILLAYIDGELCSGNFLLGNKNIVHYYKGASTIKNKNMGQGELLQWEGIKWAKEVGARYYDLCVIEKDKLPNIARFKLGFSKQIVPFDIFTKSSFNYKIITRFQQITKIIV